MTETKMPTKNKKLFQLLFLLTLLGGSFAVAERTSAATTSSISQWGITWYFDGEYEYGTFANGDYWVLGPVTITSITPEFDGYNNGWEVNPLVSGGHGFQSGCKNGGFDPLIVPDLPYTSPATGIVSIVKTIPTGLEQPCIKTAAVLTVVASAPPGNGSEVFRPPYVGSDKPYYYVSDLRTDLLPSFAPVGTPTTLQYIEDRFRKLRLDHKSTSFNRALRPQDSMMDYQPKNSEDITNSAIRLMCNDTVQQKMPALIQYVQAGIDKIHAIQLGQVWFPADGHEPAHILPSAFAVTMLDLEDMKIMLEDATFFHASKYLSSSTVGGNNLWGENYPEFSYWYYIMGLGGGRSNKDVYGFIDGGECGEAYQLITSQSHKGEILAATLMPVLQTAWPDNDFNYAKNYAERWVNYGTLAQPDPCAPVIRKQITGILTGNTTTLTSLGHGMANGTSVILIGFLDADEISDGVNDADALNEKTFVISNVSENTFDVLVDTSALSISVGASTYVLPYYRVLYGPDPLNPGMCILDADLDYYNSPTDFQCQAGQECGRFPTKNGTSVDGGLYKSLFVDAMWDAYYDQNTSFQADFDSDGDVDIFDYNILIGNFGTTGDCGNQADADGDCSVGIFDYNILLGEFGSGV